MDQEARNHMDQSSGGCFNRKGAREGFEIIERLANNSHQWGSARNNIKKNGKAQASNAVTKEDFNNLTKTVNTLAASLGNMGKRKEQVCEVSQEENNEVCYEQNQPRAEEVSYIRNQEHAYQARNPPVQTNFQAKPTHGTSSPHQQKPNYQGGRNNYQRSGQYFTEQNQRYQHPRQDEKPPQDEPSLASLVAQLVANQTQQQKESQLILQRLDQLQAHNRMLETQIAQQASSSKYQSKLPPQPDVNSSESINAITLRSGKELNEPPNNKRAEISKKASDKANLPTEVAESSKDVEAEHESETEQMLPNYVPKVPFPQRLKKKNDSAYLQRFANILNSLQVTLPFTDILTQMPNYGKFLKDIISHRKHIQELDHVSLDANCSAIIQHAMPRKLNDHGSFSIPVTIENVEIANALCDLGASISLMPFSLFQKLNMGNLTPTSISLRLADRSSRVPKGILEDVPIKVGKFYVPVDFYVLEMDD